MSNLFFRNPRLLILALALILVAGLSSYVVMPRMEDPQLTERAANVNTIFPGADAERVESLVTEKLEDELREVEEIKEIRSSSRAGVSTIAIELRDDVYEVDNIWSRIRDKINDVAADLPDGANEPEFEQLDVKAFASIVALRWTAEGDVNYAILRRLAEQLEDRLRAIPGTEKVETFGAPDEEVVVQIRAESLISLGLSSADVASQIGASDAKVAAGQLRSRHGDYILEVDGELNSIARIGRTPIRYGDGSFLQLADIAEIDKGIRTPSTSLALVDGSRAVALGVLVRADHRIDQWSQQADEALESFNKRLPKGVELARVFEQNGYVESRLTGLMWNLLFGGMAVVAVIFLMMGWRSALIVGSTLPLAALMVLTGMRFLEIPIHQMSVTGLILALGLLIDNAIVIVDDVGEHMKHGAPPAEAVSKGVKHLAVPLFGSTLTTALAFGPIALMPGPAGEFVGSIAISVILAIGSSFLLAMTVTPALTALGLPSERRSSGQEGFLSVVQDGLKVRRVRTLYEHTLAFLFRRPALGVALGMVFPVLGFIVAAQLPEQFFPPADRDQIQVELELPPQASMSETLATVEAVRNQILLDSRVERVHWFLGESAPTFYYNVIPRRKNTPRYAQALVQLNSTEGARQLIHQMQDELDRRFPNVRLLVRQLEQGPPFDAPVELRVFGPDIERLRDLGDELRGILAATPNVIHTRAELSEALPKLKFEVDEEQARQAGLNHTSIANQLNATLEGAIGGSILEATEELPVRVRVGDEDRGNLDRVASIDLLATGQTGQPARNSSYRGVPLSSVAQLRLAPEIAAIARFNGQRMNEVQAFITAGVLPAEVVSEFEKRIEEQQFRMPDGYHFEFGGEAAKRDDAIGNLMANVGVLMVLMVATLVLSFRSFRMAGLVGAVAALSVGLGLGALWAFGYPFGFMAIVGTMGLVGVAINDAIVVLAALREDPAAREGDVAAVQRVVLRSTRHIVATSLTTMAGFAPLVMAGGGFWPPLAVAIAGGVGGATILALYFIPSAYILAMCPNRCPLVSVDAAPNETPPAQVALAESA